MATTGPGGKSRSGTTCRKADVVFAAGGERQLADMGHRQPEEPTQVRSLLKATPIIFPWERRARVMTGKGRPSFQTNITRISTLEEWPSVVSMAGAYSTLRIGSVWERSSGATASRSAGVTSTFTPAPAKEKRGFKTQFSRSPGGPGRSDRKCDSGTAGCRSAGSAYFDQRKYQLGCPAQKTSRSSRKSIGSSIPLWASSSKINRL